MCVCVCVCVCVTPIRVSVPVICSLCNLWSSRAHTKGTEHSFRGCDTVPRGLVYTTCQEISTVDHRAMMKRWPNRELQGISEKTVLVPTYQPTDHIWIHLWLNTRHHLIHAMVLHAYALPFMSHSLTSRHSSAVLCYWVLSMFSCLSLFPCIDMLYLCLCHCLKYSAHILWMVAVSRSSFVISIRSEINYIFRTQCGS
jgi:hypothetical protein